MRSLILYILTIILTQTIDAQRLYLTQYSSYCESDILIDGKYIQERINRIYQYDNFWVIDATIIDDCNVKLYPKYRLLNDTLFIDTYEIERQILILENGDTIYEMTKPEECYCAYLIRMEFITDTIRNLKINNKLLPVTNERFQTFPIKYFIHDNDTTGYTDKYGLQQGHIVFEKNGFLIKQYHKDNEIIKCELCNIKGKTLMHSKDCFEIFDKLKKK